MCVAFAKVASMEKMVYLLFCNKLFLDYWRAFPSCAFFLSMALRYLFALSTAGSPTMDHGLFSLLVVVSGISLVLLELFGETKL